MSKRSDQLDTLIQNEQIDYANELVQDAEDYKESEEFVFTVLGNEKSTPELVEATLKAFLDTRENCSPQHGYWVHSLSHFTRILWERRMDRWIKKFNEVSFKGANELGDSNCSDRLVSDFGKYAKFNDDPAEFALTPENLCWMNWKKYQKYEKARIEAGRFESEEALIRWELKQSRTYTVFDDDAHIDLVNIKGIRSRIQKLRDFGADISEFTSLERDLLTKRLNELKTELSKEPGDYMRECLEKGIRKTREALA